MKKLMFVALALAASIAHAATFNLFSPATGVLKGNSTTYVTTAASAADIVAMWTGTCNSSTFLRGDGTCATSAGTPGGTNTQVQYNNSGAFGGASTLSWNPGTNTLVFGDAATAAGITTQQLTAGAGEPLTVTTSDGAAGFASGTLTITAGSSSSNTGAINNRAGKVNITGAPNTVDQGGIVAIKGGSSGGTANGGPVSITGGSAGGSGGNGGAITITGGTGGGTTGNGGAVNISSGPNSGGVDGDVVVKTGSTTQWTADHAGGITVGSPTGGAKGLGTINATGLYVNGTAVGGGGSPGGANTQVQYNNSGAFGGDSKFFYDQPTSRLILSTDGGTSGFFISPSRIIGTDGGSVESVIDFGSYQGTQDQNALVSTGQQNLNAGITADSSLYVLNNLGHDAALHVTSSAFSGALGTGGSFTGEQAALYMSGNTPFSLYTSGTERLAIPGDGSYFNVETTVQKFNGVQITQVYGKSKTSGTSRSSTTTDSPDPDLVVASLPAGIYRAQMMVNVPSAFIGGGLRYKFASTGTISTVNFTPFYNWINQTNTSFGTSVTSGDVLIPASSLSGSTSNVVMIDAMFQTTTVGDLSFSWAQETSSGTATLVGAGSSLILTKVN